MARECAASLLLVPVAGCSLLLDFSAPALPADAAIDAPYTQAECDYGEPNDTRAAAAALTPADTGPAAICPGDAEDRDFYRITVPAMTAQVEVRIAFTHGAGDLDLRLTDRAGLALAESVGFADGEAIVCPGSSPPCLALAAEDYVFEVLPAVAGAVNRYTIAVVFTPATAR